MALLTGMTPDGQEVPVQVDSSGRLVAEGLTGPEGPAGPTGPTGPAGPTGPTGPAGESSWSRTGTVVSPSNAGDQVHAGTGKLTVGGTAAAPNLEVKADGGIVANTDGLVYDAATKHLGIGTTPGFPFQVKSTTNCQVAIWDHAGIPQVIGVTDAGGSGPLRIAGTNLHFCGSGATNQEQARLSTAGVFTLGDGTINAVSLDPGSTGSPLVRDSLGRVLVGTSIASTNAKLQVEGAARLQNFANKAALDAAMPAPVAGCLATVNSKLYFRDATDWKEVTLGAPLT